MTPTTDDEQPRTLTIAFSEREWEALGRLADRNRVTPAAIVRALVQRFLATSGAYQRVQLTIFEPPPRHGRRAVAIVDEHGRRVCPICQTTPLSKRPGPGRYPSTCEACRR